MNINSTQSLVDIVLSTGARRDRHKHPATRTFQAIRMVVNQEAQVLEKGLEGALEALSVGGRLVIISFQGLEHRIIKAFVREHKHKDADVRVKQIGRAQGVSWHEQKRNCRSRSAYLRVVERIA